MKNKTIVISLFLSVLVAKSVNAGFGETIPFPQAMQTARLMVTSEFGFEPRQVMVTISSLLRPQIKQNKIAEEIVFKTIDTAITEFRVRQISLAQQKKDTNQSEEDLIKQATQASLAEQEKQAIAMSLDPDKNDSEKKEEKQKTKNKQEMEDLLLAQALAKTESEEKKRPAQKPAQPPRRPQRHQPPHAAPSSKSSRRQQERGKNAEEMDLAQALALIAEQNKQAEISDPIYGTCYALSKKLNNIPLVHLKSQQQYEDITCGSRATINAWALQTLLEENKQLTAGAIEKKAAEKSSYISWFQLRSDEIDKLATSLNINVNDTLQVFSSIEEIELLKRTINFRIDILKSKDQGCLHFICNTGIHWVLISFVKQAGKNPVMLYLNSTNAPLTPEYIGFEYIQKLHNLFFTQLIATPSESEKAEGKKDDEEK